MNAFDAFHERGQGLEAEYFRTKDAELVGKLKSVFETKVIEDDLRAATGITDKAVLERIMAANLRGEMMTAFKLYPLIEIAWADGSFDKAESEAVLSAVVRHGIPRDSDVFVRFKTWLDQGPTPEGRAVWKMYAAKLKTTLKPAELATFRDDLLKNAHAVAQASGGILGMFFSVSREEHKVLSAIKAALTA